MKKGLLRRVRRVKAIEKITSLEAIPGSDSSYALKDIKDGSSKLTI
jgi:hypothetical protein